MARLFKHFLLFLAIFLSNTLLADNTPLAERIKKAACTASYTLCIDGGGSKTELQVVDRTGKPVLLHHHDTYGYTIKAGGSNINASGKSTVEHILAELLSGVTIEEANVDVSVIADQCALVCGFSGAGSAETKAIFHNFFKKYNFAENNIIIASDADIAIETIDGDGIILISGTGSICLGKKGTDIFRVGGLGKLLGDEGSGYHIGKQALKRALEAEYGWGKTTTLTEELRAHFQTLNLKNIIAPFYNGTITNYHIASIAPLVFNQANLHDPIAQTIINEAAHDLGTMLTCIIQHGKFAPCPIHLFGGTFKNKQAPHFIQKIVTAAHLDGWPILNKTHENPIVLTVQRLQKDTIKASTSTVQRDKQH